MTSDTTSMAPHTEDTKQTRDILKEFAKENFTDHAKERANERFGDRMEDLIEERIHERIEERLKGKATEGTKARFRQRLDALVEERVHERIKDRRLSKTKDLIEELAGSGSMLGQRDYLTYAPATRIAMRRGIRKTAGAAALIMLGYNLDPSRRRKIRRRIRRASRHI